jgi:hypothetical protein
MRADENFAIRQELEHVAFTVIAPIKQPLRTHLIVLQLNATHRIVLRLGIAVAEEPVHFERGGDRDGPDLDLGVLNVDVPDLGVLQLLKLIKLNHLELPVICYEQFLTH